MPTLSLMAVPLSRPSQGRGAASGPRATPPAGRSALLGPNAPIDRNLHLDRHADRDG